MTFCPECGETPCKCGTIPCQKIGDLELVTLQYMVEGKVFRIVVPFDLVRQYQELYNSILLMDANGNIIEYSSVQNSGVGGKEKDNGTK
jgi:hypothetical protein